MMRAVKLAMACLAVVVVTAGQVQAGMITTTFAGGNGSFGNMFNVLTLVLQLDFMVLVGRGLCVGSG
jgi:hypothetical protein